MLKESSFILASFTLVHVESGVFYIDRYLRGNNGRKEIMIHLAWKLPTIANFQRSYRVN